MTAPSSTRASLIDQIHAAGILPGDAVIVHSSMKSVGPVEGGPQTVVSALLDAVGSKGTLLMPTFADPPVDSVFEVRRTPSRVGLITEVFRTFPQVMRSWHPTHAVSAAGLHTEWLEGHEKTSGLGAQSPLHRAAEGGAKVLMLGCAITSCSIIHVAEAISRVPYLGRVWYQGYDRTMVVITPDGQRLTIPPLDPPTCSDGFGVVQQSLDAKGLIQHPRIGQTECLLFSGDEVITTTMAMLELNPGALLCGGPRCPVCPRARHLLGVTK